MDNNENRNNSGGKEPDFDKIIQQVTEAFQKIGLAKLIPVIVLVVLAVWALSGVYTVQPAEQGVLLRFGKYQRTVSAGLHWYPRFIEKKYILNTMRVNSLKFNAVMLTSGENFVHVEFAVQYRIGNLQNYLFNVINPVNSLQQIIDSSIREVIGTSTLDNILTVGRSQIAQSVKVVASQLTNKYKNGIQIIGVEMQPSQPPPQVQEAFDDVIKAREDNQRVQNIAQGYASSVVPVAQGRAKAMMRAAQAFQKQVVLLAQGKVAQFNAILPKYKLAPKVTAERMYIDSMQQVLSRSHLILMDGGPKSGNLFYLPLQQWLGQMKTSEPSVSHSLAMKPGVINHVNTAGGAS